MILTGEQTAELKEAIVKAYREQELEILLSEKMAQSYEAIARGGDYRTRAFNLIEMLESNGGLEEFITVIKNDKPNSPYFKIITQFRDIPIHDIPNLGMTISKDDKYKGELVFFELYLCNEDTKKKKIDIILDITFGEAEEQFPIKSKFTKENPLVKFGIKSGKLRLNFENAELPLSKRANIDLINSFQINLTGNSENPVWEFEPGHGKKILKGRLSPQELGVIDVLSNACIITGSFETIIHINNIEITSQYGVWDENTPTLKIKNHKVLFIKYIKPQLEDYLCQLILKYELRSNS